MPQTVPGASDRSIAPHCTPGPAPSLPWKHGLGREAGTAPSSHQYDSQEGSIAPTGDITPQLSLRWDPVVKSYRRCTRQCTEEGSYEKTHGKWALAFSIWKILSALFIKHHANWSNIILNPFYGSSQSVFSSCLWHELRPHPVQTGVPRTLRGHSVCICTTAPHVKDPEKEPWAPQAPRTQNRKCSWRAHPVNGGPALLPRFWPLKSPPGPQKASLIPP